MRFEDKPIQVINGPDWQTAQAAGVVIGHHDSMARFFRSWMASLTPEVFSALVKAFEEQLDDRARLEMLKGPFENEYLTEGFTQPPQKNPPSQN